MPLKDYFSANNISKVQTLHEFDFDQINLAKLTNFYVQNPSQNP